MVAGLALPYAIFITVYLICDDAFGKIQLGQFFKVKEDRFGLVAV